MEPGCWDSDVVQTKNIHILGLWGDRLQICLWEYTLMLLIFLQRNVVKMFFFLSRHCAMHTLCTHCQKWMSLHLNPFPRSVLSSHSLSSWCLPFIPMPCSNLTFHLSEKRKHSIPFINYQVVTNTADHCLPSCDHPFATLVTWYYFIFLGQHIRDLEKVINHYSEATDHTG